MTATLAALLLAATAKPSLGYRPFIDPIDRVFDAHRWWFLLLIPLAVGISMAYRGVRLKSLDLYWREVAIMTTQIILGIVALGAFSFVIIQYVAPIILPR